MRLAVTMPGGSVNNLFVGKILDDDDDGGEDDNGGVVGPLGSLLPVLSPSSLFKEADAVAVEEKRLVVDDAVLVSPSKSGVTLTAMKGGADSKGVEAVAGDEDDDEEEEDEDEGVGEDEPVGTRGPKRSVQNIPYTVTRSGFQRLFKCDSCDRSFSRKGSLFRHYREKHATTTPAFHCQYCNYVSCKKTNLGIFTRARMKRTGN